ncbi:helix-turn-helix domain-containing protein [Erythrobacter rubeus]|uniref:Helix-turn-helix domain-containing protein n=1 Tax=Erythrobacter rubeus TaxID=2760803 RepID=A0ABR8KLZ3_9SPHN|nr:helix-turn-helix domain-containing protein [Erythrobacter rubeus]MBD2841509.1 helix-turn-helix domain-containing protein [Erythrobacter rubeus]
MSTAAPLNPAQLAERWDVSTTLIYDLLNAGSLKGFKLGKLWRIPLAAVEAYEQQGSETAQPPADEPVEPPEVDASTIARMTRIAPGD